MNERPRRIRTLDALNYWSVFADFARSKKENNANARVPGERNTRTRFQVRKVEKVKCQNRFCQRKWKDKARRLWAWKNFVSKFAMKANHANELCLKALKSAKKQHYYAKMESALHVPNRKNTRRARLMSTHALCVCVMITRFKQRIIVSMIILQSRWRKSFCFSFLPKHVTPFKIA